MYDVFMHMMQNIGMTSFKDSKFPSVFNRSESIKEHLGSLNQQIPYFEGLPFIDYEDREINWGNVVKGIFSPYNNKWQEFIIHELEKKPNIKIEGFEKRNLSIREKVNKVFSRMSTLILKERESKITPSEILEADLLNNKHRLINHITKSTKYESLSEAMKNFQVFYNNYDLMKYERVLKPGQKMTSSLDMIRDDFY